jgi:squalene-associated FAD-dependent desaturase
MNALEDSYRCCRRVASRSGSNFYRAFGLLAGDRRRAMDALYAFARIADDISDASDTNRVSTSNAWSPQTWHDWVEQLAGSTTGGTCHIPELAPIQLAVADATQRFAIPRSVYHDLVDGIEFDQKNQVCLETWGQLVQYCRRVATSVGRGCLAIWAKEIGSPPSDELLRLGDACGIAFQLTNIIRDVVEDAKRGRCYLPDAELKRFGIVRQDWMEHLRLEPARVNQLYVDLVQTMIERAAGLYDVSWEMRAFLCSEGQRMFSLMWSTYRSLLREIETSPIRVFQTRVTVRTITKCQLAVSHFVTPLYRKHIHQTTGECSSIRHESRWLPGDDRKRKVAVIGGGLAGCNAAIHLARHGVDVELFEGRSRLGGRVGSFFDKESNSWIDYCQHVGMKCCTELRRWIHETRQTESWTEQKSLHFVAHDGTKIAIHGWPLPAPLHLASLLWKWPDLRWSDRFRVGRSLWKLYRMKPLPEHDRVLAIDWLKDNGQSEQSLSRFWETILVSALGERLNRVTLGATRKVLVDGFARDRDAFHLLVPNQPLSDVVDKAMQQRMRDLNVTLVSRLERSGSIWEIVMSDNRRTGFDAVVVAVPWHQIDRLLPDSHDDATRPSLLASSPITGIHTWWDRPWLKEPHAILVGGLCQWIFPGPASTKSESTDSTYYQIVISASRDLPKGDTDKILRAVQEDLSRAYPGSREANLLRGKVVTDPHAVFSVEPSAADCRWRVDRLRESDLFVAGDWTETGWPATMEGALRSGIFAAECVLARWGHPTRLVSKSTGC